MAEHDSRVNRLIRFCMENRLVVFCALVFLAGWGVWVAPFNWDLGFERETVNVDAIPDIGENQQIVFTLWEGRSPQDIQDQITYPLTTTLLGMPKVKTIRSFSYFGFSSIYVIFDDDAEFYWTRSRILEKLNALPSGTLPAGVQPQLGPDATALGQVFWYTLEGRDVKDPSKPTGGWDPQELRTLQDWTVRYALQSAEGVAEVASVGGYVQEYQVDVDPDALRAAGVTLEQVFSAVRESNVDVGARTIEINRVEYVIRGLGFIKTLEDLRQTVVAVRENVPIRVQDVAEVTLGPAMRRGALTKGGTEAAGGVVVVRFGANPLKTIENVKRKIAELKLPSKTLPDGTVSRVAVVPFYDRTGLIRETLGTLNDALTEQALIVTIVVLVLVFQLRGSLVISSILPLSILICFIGMKLFKVDANLMALAGIAIAIGDIADMGIVLCENIIQHLKKADPKEKRFEVVYRAAAEVGGAVTSAMGNTIVSFIPVFFLEASEGKLFRPLAYTKCLALGSSIVLALVVIPSAAHLLFAVQLQRVWRNLLCFLALVLGCALGVFVSPWLGMVVAGFAAYGLIEEHLPARVREWAPWLGNGAVLLLIVVVLAERWMMLGVERGWLANVLFAGAFVGVALGFFLLFLRAYPHILRWCLAHKAVFLAVPAVLLLFGITIWLGFNKVFFFVPDGLRATRPAVWLAHELPGLGREFMPPLDEGSFLYMPTTMPHASVGEALDVLQKLDRAILTVPEVDQVVGKLGRVESALDPAPISMVETIINYKSEYRVDEDGRRLRFRYDESTGSFPRDGRGEPIPDADGREFRNWRPHIRSRDDIWKAIVDAAQLPGTTSAPKLQPIETRIIMLQSGIRAPMAVKIRGPKLETIEQVGLQIEKLLKDVPSLNRDSVVADRIVGQPYIEIEIDRRAIARYGLTVRAVQDVIEVALGGVTLTTTVEGRQRFPVRVRYLREMRDRLETLGRVLVSGPGGAQVPLMEVAEIRYVRGPMAIRSEDTFLTGYVLFDKQAEVPEVDAVEAARDYLDAKLAEFDSAYHARAKELGRDLTAEEREVLPGLNLRGCEKPVFAGTYENQVRASKRLMIVIPLTLLLVFLMIYLEFRSFPVTVFVFSSVAVAMSGGFIMLWLYGQPWFLDISIFGANLREMFQVHPINLSVAVWVGFIALFGVAEDDSVIMATYLNERFAADQPATVEAIRAAVLESGLRRIRPCLMTTATTVLGMLPLLTSQGRGADVMIPMAIPSIGGMTMQLLSLFIMPTLYCWLKERQLRRATNGSAQNR